MYFSPFITLFCVAREHEGLMKFIFYLSFKKGVWFFFLYNASIYLSYHQADDGSQIIT